MKYAIFFILLFLIACAKPAPPTVQQPPLKPLTGAPPSAVTTTIDGQTIAYNIYPAKPGSPGVILLHMLRRTKNDWDTVAKWLQKNGYTVIAPDLRGHGQSTGNWEQFTPEDFNKMTLDVQAVKSVLENQGADVKKLAIIGASIGANIAFNYAATDNDVKTVILLSPGLEYRGVTTMGTRFSKPFLVVASKDDQYSAQSSQEIANNNPTAELILYDDAGHGTNMFVKNELAPTILEWLQEQLY
jgi:pimeloyl-ACP methyl ester carboxylesterase